MAISIKTYPYKTPPYDHQFTALEKGWDKREYAWFMEMGTGKTKVAIDNMAMLWDTGDITGVVIIAPKGVYRNWSEKEIPQHFPLHVPLNVAVWSTHLTKKVRESLNSLFKTKTVLNILVINIDALITQKGSKVIELFLKAHVSMILIDESTTIKTPSAKRTKQAVKFSKMAAYRRILTGSPVTKSPLDLYTQCAFLNPHLLGFTSYYSFRNRYAILRTMDYGGRSFKQVVSYKNVDELAEEIKEFSYRVTKDECLDLPEKIFIKREFEMTKEQKDAYNQMKLMAMAFIENHTASDGVILEATVTSVITQLLRLHQISCGHLPMDDGTILDIKNNRLTELMDLLEETDGKVIIWANYRRDIFRISEAISKAYGKESLVTYFGDTSDEDRTEAVANFQDPADPVRFFLGNTQTGGYGITLTEARTVVYYSNNYDLEKRLQSEDRTHRIGQHHPVTYVDLMCKSTIDEKIITALRNKQDIARTITGDNWRDWI